jgi:hypothetical protein
MFQTSVLRLVAHNGKPEVVIYLKASEEAGR